MSSSVALSMCMHEVWNTCSSVSKVDVSWLSAFKVRFMSITDKVRYIRITDKVRYTRNTDFVYNGQKTLVPTGTLYARFTVFNNNAPSHRQDNTYHDL